MENKPKHTPGLWEMGGSLLASTSGKHIAIVLHNINYDEKKLPRDYDSRAPKSFPETEANARLIAAAPELLAFARYVATHGEMARTMANDAGRLLSITEFVAQAKSLLAKAEGGTNA